MKTATLLILSAVCSAGNEQARFFKALADKESGGNPKAYNKAEDAVGCYQVRRVYVDDCNRILGRKAFTYSDRWDKAKSEQMIIVYLRHYVTAKRLGYKPTWFDYARAHNGGPFGHKKQATINYANDVVRRMK